MIKRIIKFLIVKRKSVFYILTALAIAAYLTFSGHGLLKRYQVMRENKALEEQIKLERAEQDSLRLISDKLKYDRYEIERIAREHYGMIKPGEKVYIVPTPEKKEDKPE